jgi:NADP-dependent 3-hydroxy acid dehydrogenase YdfG
MTLEKLQLAGSVASDGMSAKAELTGQTVVVIGASSGIGLETARRARAEGANVILTGRNPERLQRAASELGALSTAAFDATDPAPLERFFRDLPTTIDHVMVTAGRPYYGRIVDMDFAQARRALEDHLLLVLQVARNAADKVRPGGTLLFMGGTGGRRPGVGLGIASTITAALPALPPASSTRRCRHRSSAISSRTAAISFAPRFPSGASSDRPTSPRSPYTS